MRQAPLLLALALLTIPLVPAHAPMGIAKDYCEDPAEWGVHDYGAAAAPSIVGVEGSGQDGNQRGDCDGNGTPGDYDGHIEYALGGAMLLANNGDAASTGSIACGGGLAHHAPFGPFFAEDANQGTSVAFRVVADTVNLLPPTEPHAPMCGDFQADESAACVGTCTVSFDPGLDGAYYVLMDPPATRGHVWTGAYHNGTSMPECSDALDNDSDLWVDWPADPQCASPSDDDERS